MSEAPADSTVPAASWALRAADRSPSVQRSRARSVQRAQQIVLAARRLATVKGANFTIHELVKEAGVALQTFYKHFEGKELVDLTLVIVTINAWNRFSIGFNKPVPVRDEK